MNRREFQLSLGALTLSQVFEGARAPAAPTSSPAPFRFSVMLWTLDDKAPFEQRLETVASAGYQGVELVTEYQKWSPADFQRNVARIHSLGLVVDTIAGLKTGFADPAATDALIREFSSAIPVAKQLGCPQIILLSGPQVGALSHETQHQASVENLKRVADIAAERDIKIVIEPIDPLENPTIWLTSVTEGFKIVREVSNPSLKVLYDFYHEQRCAGNLIEKLENNIDWVGLVHIADVPGRHEPGTGEVDYKNIYRKLAELDYDKFVAMEFYPTEDPAASLRKARVAAQEAVEARLSRG
jgi:hydroxypyruvate isomerase